MTLPETSKARFPFKRKTRHRRQPVSMPWLPEGTPIEVRRAAGFVLAARRAADREATLPMSHFRAHARRAAKMHVRIAAADEGHSWALAVCWLLRWCKPDGWQGPISERKAGHRTAEL